MRILKYRIVFYDKKHRLLAYTHFYAKDIMSVWTLLEPLKQLVDFEITEEIMGDGDRIKG